MKKEEKLNLLFDGLADEISITNTMLDKAESAYNGLANYIKNHNDEWDVVIYPQGSFELGTVIKPLNDQEEYDVDLVILIKSPAFDPQEIRDEVLKLLESYGRYNGKIEEKKPCIRIQYAESAQFHMDIASARDVKSLDDSIEIARFDGIINYYYEPSNPKGYISWFKNVMRYETILKEKRAIFEAQANTEVQDLRLSRMRTPLQKAIQILKRHRDIYFSKNANTDNKPSSIIITTLCAMAYADRLGRYNKDNIYLTICNLLETFPNYIKRNANNEYYLENPSNKQENFLKKWNDNYNLVNAFNEWILKAKHDIITDPEKFIEDNPIQLRELLLESFGDREVKKALDTYGNRVSKLATDGHLKYDSKTANVVTSSVIGSSYNSHTFFGGE